MRVVHFRLLSQIKKKFYKKVLDIKILKKFKFNRTQNIITGQSKIRQKNINDYKMIFDNFDDTF